MSPRGRRPGGSDTRAEIVEAAREEFAENGYAAASLRAIARRAGVDPALVHHYFGGKPELFGAVMTVPVNPAEMVECLLAAPRDRVGETLAQVFFAIWDAPDARVRLLAILRSAMTHEDAARMLREFLAGEVLHPVLAKTGGERLTTSDAKLRVAAAEGQLLGVAMLRYVIAFPGLAEADVDEIVAMIGPALQRYLVVEE